MFREINSLEPREQPHHHHRQSSLLLRAQPPLAEPGRQSVAEDQPGHVPRDQEPARESQRGQRLTHTSPELPTPESQRAQHLV